MKKFLKIMAIVYLAWAVFYSVLSASTMLRNVKAYKTSGVSDVLWRADQLGYAPYSLSKIDPKRGIIICGVNAQRSVIIVYSWRGRPFTNTEIANISFGSDRIIEVYNLKKKKITLVIYTRESTKKLEKGFKKLKINNRSFHPSTDLAPISFINRWGGTFETFKNTLGNHPLIIIYWLWFMITVFPLKSFIDLAIAFSPYPIFYLTAFIPTVFYVFLIWLSTKGLISKNKG